MNKIEHLREELERLIEKFRNESTRHKSLSRRLKYSLFALTGCATILSSAALKSTNYHDALNLGVVLVSVSASIVSSIEALRKPAELWVHERNVFHALSDLKRELEYEASGGSEIRVDQYFERMQRMLAASTEVWTRRVQPRHATE